MEQTKKTREIRINRRILIFLFFFCVILHFSLSGSANERVSGIFFSVPHGSVSSPGPFSRSNRFSSMRLPSSTSRPYSALVQSSPRVVSRRGAAGRFYSTAVADDVALPPPDSAANVAVRKQSLQQLIEEIRERKAIESENDRASRRHHDFFL